MKKTFLSYFIILIAMFLFAGCGGSKNPPQQVSTTPVSQQAQNTTQQPTPVDEELEAIFKVKPEDYDPMFNEEEQKKLIIPDRLTRKILDQMDEMDKSDLITVIKIVSDAEFNDLFSDVMILKKENYGTPSETMIIHNGIIIVDGYIFRGKIEFSFYPDNNEICINGLPFVRKKHDILINDNIFKAKLANMLWKKKDELDPNTDKLLYSEFLEYKSELNKINLIANSTKSYSQDKWKETINDEIKKRWPDYIEADRMFLRGYGYNCKKMQFLMVNYVLKENSTYKGMNWSFDSADHPSFIKGLEECRNSSKLTAQKKLYEGMKRTIASVVKIANDIDTPFYILNYKQFIYVPELESILDNIDKISKSNLSKRQKALRISVLFKDYYITSYAKIVRVFMNSPELATLLPSN